MRSCLVLILCATGISAYVAVPYNVSINQPVASHLGINRQNRPIKRFACPMGFFRLKRYCYYLSAGTAPWREAHFHCKDRNATLAMLDRSGKDRMLRNYLMGDRFTKLERWIGGIFNWQKMAWEWGVTGDKMEFQNFGRPQSGQPKQQYAWHCITIDPNLKYRWSPRSCVERKHYVCEVPAGRMAKRLKKMTDPMALKKHRKGKKYSKDAAKPQKGRRKSRPAWKRNWTEQNADDYWAEQNANDYWAHGVNLGSRPPANNRVPYMKTRVRHRPNRTQPHYSAPTVSQILPQGQGHSTFLGDGPSNGPQSLTDISKVLLQNRGKINDLASEEVLLKP